MESYNLPCFATPKVNTFWVSKPRKLSLSVFCNSENVHFPHFWFSNFCEYIRKSVTKFSLSVFCNPESAHFPLSVESVEFSHFITWKVNTLEGFKMQKVSTFWVSNPESEEIFTHCGKIMYKNVGVNLGPIGHWLMEKTRVKKSHALKSLLMFSKTLSSW